jgi:hypothetical protein
MGSSGQAGACRPPARISLAPTRMLVLEERGTGAIEHSLWVQAALHMGQCLASSLASERHRNTPSFI